MGVLFSVVGWLVQHSSVLPLFFLANILSSFNVIILVHLYLRLLLSGK